MLPKIVFDKTEFVKLKISNNFKPVLRLRDVYPGSWILIFTHPGSQIPDPGYQNSNKKEG
jgi:hypothetical protein